jgi:EAL domain-containing protein (putative c-di-GMP-specific phosphodiesterase class I)
LGKSMGFTIVAEGVETEAQRDFLGGEACDEVQGFLLGRPMNAEAAVSALGGGGRDSGEAGLRGSRSPHQG